MSCGMHSEECRDSATHHFLKYHDPKSEFYLGGKCVNCVFGRVDRERTVLAQSAAPVEEVARAIYLETEGFTPLGRQHFKGTKADQIEIDKIAAILSRRIPAPATPQNTAKDKICAEIQNIMCVYREQDASSYGVDTPGGLEHMGDVWKLLGEWDRKLGAIPPCSEPPELCQEVHPGDFLFCNLPKGHAGKHQDSPYEWSQESPHTIERIAPQTEPLSPVPSPESRSREERP